MTAPHRAPVDVYAGLKDRLLTMATAEHVINLAGNVDPDIGGLVIVGGQNNTHGTPSKRRGPKPTAFDAARQLQRERPDVTVLIQPDVHKRHAASVDHPFPINADDPPGGTLIDVARTLESYIDAYRRNGSDYAILPTGYLDAGMGPEFQAVVLKGNTVKRTDVLAHFPLSTQWLVAAGARKQLIAGIGRSIHPVLLSLESRTNPTDPRRVVDGLHEVLAAAGEQVGLWHTDLSALDGLANGAWCGGIGLLAGNRHIVAPGNTAIPRRPKDKTPNVLLPDWLRYQKAATMTINWFANGHEPTCDCGLCFGRKLTRFGTSTADHLEAHRHNMLATIELVRRVLTAQDSRQAQWAQMLADARAVHAAAAVATQVMTIAFDAPLKNWANTNPVPNPAVR
ncbi:MAG: hypothetical protein ACR2LX_01560 [Jatrophihabitans sp.]